MPLPHRSLKKTTLSLFLRTGCDRELYLSLFSANAANLTAGGIPVPLKARPNVQLVTQAGRTFEQEAMELLVREIPSNVRFTATPRFDPLDLRSALASSPRPA